MKQEREIINQMQDTHVDMMALMPCPIKVPFEKLIYEFIENTDGIEPSKLNVVIEGHANHHLSFYEQLEQINDIEHIPDIIITPGINALFGEKFRKSFVDKGYFQLVLPEQIEEGILKTGYLDPEERYSMFAMNILVMVIYKPHLPTEKVPKSLEDILGSEYKGKIVLRGQKQYYCESVLLSFEKLFGVEGVKQLAQNTLFGCHPSEMIKLIKTDSPGGGAVYIMPYFYAKTIETDPDVEVVWPKEGAIVNAISMLVKKDARKEVKQIAEYIVGKEVGEMFTGAFFPSSHKSNKDSYYKNLLWMGWEYINDLTVTKRIDELNQLFW